MSDGQYTPTQDDLVNVIRLLHENGVEVSNSKAAYNSLKAYEGNPQFCILLSAVYSAEECPVSGLNLPVPWVQYRQLAAITLKNNVSVAKHALGENAVSQVARCALGTLCNPPDERIARASAQIVVKVTELTSFEWWASVGLGDLADTLLNKLLSSGGLKTLAALYALQYLMEDMPRQVGQASESIVDRVAKLSVAPQTPLELRKAAFRLCFSIYERSSLLDWNVEVLSPLQMGLTNASWVFAQTCTTLLEMLCENDVSLMTAVLRSCVFLLDYFDFFLNMTAADQQRMTQFWVVNTAGIIVQNTGSQGNDELIGTSIDLITAVLAAHDASNGEGVSAFLAAPIAQNVPAVIPALVKYSFMSEEEEQNIMETDDYRTREHVPVRFSNGSDGKDLTKDDALDDDEAAMTLRRSALRCVDQLCCFTSTAAFNILKDQISPLWASADWRSREAGVVLVGTMVTGCSMHLGEILQGTVSRLITFAGNPNEHVCVSSISIWALSRLVEDMLASVPQSFDAYLAMIISRMPSTSKRIQHTSVSAVNGALWAMRNFSCESRLMSHFESLLQAITVALPMYSGVSLSLLADLTSQLLVTLKGLGADQVIAQLGESLKKERAVKAQAFEQSYNETYVKEAPNSFVNVDVFSLDRGLVNLLSFIPDGALAAANLSVWNGVLRDVITRNLLDEVNLVLGVVSVCFGYFCCLSSSAQQQWNQSTGGSLPQSVMQVLSTAKNARVKSAAVTMLETMVKMLGASAVGGSEYDPIVQFLAEQISNEDDAQLMSDCVQLVITLVLQNSEKSSSAATTAALAAISSGIRNDVYGDTLYHHTGMAYQTCRLLEVAPALAGNFNLDVISSLIAAATNDMDKSEATVRWSGALCAAPANVLGNVVGKALVVVISWQQAAPQFPGTAQALSAIVRRLATECREATEAQMRNYPPVVQQMITTQYLQ